VHPASEHLDRDGLLSCDQGLTISSVADAVVGVGVLVELFVIFVVVVLFGGLLAVVCEFVGDVLGLVLDAGRRRTRRITKADTPASPAGQRTAQRPAVVAESLCEGALSRS
jgi:Flp pilus assembly protein TadB